MPETRIVYVRTSERMAAQEIIARAERFGRKVDPLIAKIANARRASPADPDKQVAPTA